MIAMLAGCPSPPQHPREPAAATQTLEVARPSLALRGVAGDRDRLYAAFADPARSAIEARRDGAVAWTTVFDGTIGSIARTGEVVVAGVGATGESLRGRPGAFVLALDAATGATRWRLALDSTAWSIIAAVAPAPDGGAIVGGSFAGTLRAGARVVSSAGGSDGFVARVSATGQLVSLIRLGGSFADAVQGVAATPDGGIAIAGLFTSQADVLGHPLEPIDEQLATADAFVAELDAAGAVRWTRTFGGKGDDAVAGVAVDNRGRIAVAATARGEVRVGSVELTARGPADGLVVWLGPGGELGTATLLGGDDFDGLRAITAVGDRVVVGGFFSGAIEVGGRRLAAGGGDDAFLAAIAADGTVSASWQIGGEGREDVAALAPVPGGFVAGITHTAAATVDVAKLPSPADPLTGAALAVRGW